MTVAEIGPRHRAIRRALVAVLGLNLAVAAAKIVAGLADGSLGMVADGFHSVTDGAANVVGLVGLAVAMRPPDASHPYGHRKFETLTALAIGGLLAVTAWEILSGVFRRWDSAEVPDASPLALGVMVGSVVVSLAVSTWERRAGERLESEILVADSAHTRSDVYASLVVIASLLGTRAGLPRLDLVAAILVTALIAKAAYEIVRDSVDALADAAAVSSEAVRRVAVSVPGVLGVHKIRSRQGGHCDLHVQVAADLPLDRAHVIAHLVADRIRLDLELSDVVVHVEPPEGHRTAWLPG